MLNKNSNEKLETIATDKSDADKSLTSWGAWMAIKWSKLMGGTGDVASSASCRRNELPNMSGCLNATVLTASRKANEIGTPWR